jgi:NAD(P)H-hydrate epimerase
MENAARSITEYVKKFYDVSSKKTVGIICGKGNNGGDGFATARHLSKLGIETIIYALSPRRVPPETDADINRNIAEKMSLKIVTLTERNIYEFKNDFSGCGLLIDAIFGTGLENEIVGFPSKIINLINEIDVPVLSIDIPSGLDCDSGKPLGSCIKAKWTVTLVAQKISFFKKTAQPYIGEVVIGDIGIPDIRKYFLPVFPFS